MITLEKLLAQHQQELFQLGLFPRDLDQENFGYFLDHGNFPDNHFVLEKCSMDQILFLLRLIKKVDNTKTIGPLRNQLRRKLKNELISSSPYSKLVTRILNDETIKGEIVDGWIQDCQYLIYRFSNPIRDSINLEIDKIVRDTISVFQISTLLELEDIKTFGELKSEIMFAMKTDNRFYSKFKNEYYSSENQTRDETLEQLI